MSVSTKTVITCDRCGDYYETKHRSVDALRKQLHADWWTSVGTKDYCVMCSLMRIRVRKPARSKR